MDKDASDAERLAEYQRCVAGTSGAYQKTVEEALRPRATPEDYALLKLQECTAQQAAEDFSRALCIPHNLLAWVRSMSARRPDGALGNDGCASAQAFFENLCRVFLLEDLQVTVKVGTVDKSCTIYPFGLVHPYISIPLSLFKHDAAVLACINRMLLVEQADVTSPFYSSKGGAFGVQRQVAATGQVLYTGFNYNAVCSSLFPRAQFVACFLCELSASAYSLDLANNVDVDKALSMVANGDCTQLQYMPALDDMLEHMSSETTAARLLCYVTLRDLRSELSRCLWQADLRRSAVRADGKVQEVSSTTVRQARSMRRIRVALPHLAAMLAACESFKVKDLLVCWFMCQARAASK